MTIDDFMTTHRYGYNLGRFQKFEYYDLDKSYIDMISNNRFSLIVKSRQMHFTDVMAAYTAWYLLFNTNKEAMNSFYLTTSLRNGYYFKEKVKTHLKQYGFNNKDYLIDNRGKLTLPNENSLTILSTTIDSICGFKIDGLLIVDEAAHIKNFKSIYTSLITSIGKHCKVMIGSTPNGVDYFFRLYDYSIKGNNIFKSLHVNYKNHPLRDELWYEEMCNSLDNNEEIIKVELLGEFFIDKVKKENKGNQIIFRVEDDMMSKIGKKLIDFDIKISDYIRNLINNDLNKKGN